MPNRLLVEDARFAAILDTLDPVSEIPRSDGLPEAAVAVVIRARPTLDVLLIKRSERDGDPWSGHMAFPGGRREEQDDELLYASIRETIEETGLDLREVGTPIGGLDEVAPRSVNPPDMTVKPFVFAALPDADAHVASAEVETIHWVSLRHLCDPVHRSSLTFRYAGQERTFESVLVDGHHVWGMTFRVIQDLLERVEQIEGF